MADHVEQIGRAGDILRDADAALYVGMSESWLRQTRMIGRTDGPPFVRVGTRSIRYRRSDLDRWLEQRCSASAAAQRERTPPHEQRPRTRNVQRPRQRSLKRRRRSLAK